MFTHDLDLLDISRTGFCHGSASGCLVTPAAKCRKIN